MRHLPKLPYSGLAVILSNPSRFDKYELLSGYAGKIFNDALAPSHNRHVCDVMTAQELSNGKSLLPSTKAVLMMGEGCLKLVSSNKRTLNQQRGSPFIWNELPTILTYFPQDCVDFKNYESEFNTQADSTNSIERGDDDKNHGKTSKENWHFWMHNDVRKLLRIKKDPTLLNSHPKYDVITYPSSSRIIDTLSSTKGECLYLDIETDMGLNITCFSFGFVSSCIFVVPFIRFNYSKCYSDLDTCKILRALAVAMRDNEVCCHNSMFDLFILAWKYIVPCGRRIYDTMLGAHRCNLEVEKSLGHCISLYTYLPYHKDEGCFMPNNPQQEQQLWKYNAKDVYSMILVRQAIDKHAPTVRGLEDSIRQANESIRPYLITMLLGIAYDDGKRKTQIVANDKAMNQCLRAMRLLVGTEIAGEISARSKMGFIMSSQQCANYFHEVMGYSIMKKSEKTGEPSVDEKVLQKMRLKYPDNIVIDFLLSYRGLKKMTGTLNFTPWSEQPIF